MYRVMETTWVCGELSLEREGVHAWVCICLCARGQIRSCRLCAQVAAVSNRVFVCFRLPECAQEEDMVGGLECVPVRAPLTWQVLEMSAFLAADLGLVPLGVSAERGLEGTCLSERDRKRRGGQPSLGFPGGKARHWNLSTLPPSLPPPPCCCLPSWRLKAVGRRTDRQTVHT